MVEEIEIMVEEIEIMVEEIEMVDIILDGEIDQILNLETYLHGHKFFVDTIKYKQIFNQNYQVLIIEIVQYLYM